MSDKGMIRFGMLKTPFWVPAEIFGYLLPDFGYLKQLDFDKQYSTQSDARKQKTRYF